MASPTCMNFSQLKFIIVPFNTSLRFYAILSIVLESVWLLVADRGKKNLLDFA
jgi:hypothetical protein